FPATSSSRSSRHSSRSSSAAPTRRCSSVPEPGVTGAVDEPGFVGAAFAARADRTPDRIAVDTGTAPLAAGALLSALEAVAAAIRPGEVVAVTARNDGATLARILGIARAGGLAATLDPSWPATQRDAALAALAPDRVL